MKRIGFLEHAFDVIDDANSRLGTKISVKDFSTEYKLNEDWTEGYKWEWDCQHIQTERDDVDSYFGNLVSSDSITVCMDCGAVYNEVEKRWERER